MMTGNQTTSDMTAGNQTSDMTARNQTSDMTTGNDTSNMKTGNETSNMKTGNETSDMIAGNQTSDTMAGSETIHPIQIHVCIHAHLQRLIEYDHTLTFNGVECPHQISLFLNSDSTVEVSPFTTASWYCAT